MINIRKLEAELWDSADLLRAGSKLTSNQYWMPVLGLIFLRYAHGRFKLVEAELLKNRPVRNGRVMPVEASDFAEKSALFLPPEARYDYLVNLPESADIGKAVNHAMELIEEQSEQLVGVLPKDYTMFTDEILSELLRIFNNSALDEVGGTVLAIHPDTNRNELQLLFVNVDCHSKGVGYAAWQAIEALHPETEVWETHTPYFDQRNIHFYINKCGFHMAEFFCKAHPEPGEDYPDDVPGGDGFCRFEKRMK